MFILGFIFGAIAGIATFNFLENYQIIPKKGGNNE
ncbi:Uncharacterised protein [Phocoenobacter uteri]|uniref:Uncharacterized protein n=1 Tax=Phocoenobacter uteri TaxID=146806 RepID=A0A379C9J2_9PAST|nr:Uncharacterised protein [Phocoenobacter uteri]